MLSAEQVQTWSVQEAADWCKGLLGDAAAQVATTKNLDGPTLLRSTEADLKQAGFSGLQARKIKLQIPTVDTTSMVPPSTTASTEPSTAVSTASSSAQVQDLQRQITELRAQIFALKVSSSTTANKTPAATTPFHNVAAHTVQVPGFCSGCRIEGNQIQVLTVTMGPGDVVRAEPGAMVHKSDFIDMSTKTAGQGLDRWLTGQSLFLTEFSYRGPPGTADTLCLTPDFPSQIVPVSLDDYGGCILCQKASLLASAASIQVTVEFTKRVGAGFFGGEGFILQGLRGSGMAFLNARGTTIKMVLDPGERRTVASGCLVAFQESVQYQVRTIDGGLGNVLFGGEGLFVTEMVGPGTIWLESHDMSRLFQAMHTQTS